MQPEDRAGYHTAMLERGLVQVYTGDGKGKTTAALGLALRAVGRGLRVKIFQFLKPDCLDLGERRAICTWGLPVEIQAVGGRPEGGLVDQRWAQQARQAVSSAWPSILEAAAAGRCDLLILDELAYCIAKGLVELELVRQLVTSRAPSVEVVITGRDAPEGLLAMADLVTRMEKVRHPYDLGMGARPGIDY